MRATVSLSGGVCVIAEDSSASWVNLANLTIVPRTVAHIHYGAIQDWEILEEADRNTLLQSARDRYYLFRATANIEDCLLGDLSATLQNILMDEVENALKVSVHFDSLVAALLRAPISEPRRLEILAAQCLSQGMAATAGVLDAVRMFQPALSRLSDRWLMIKEEAFAQVANGRKQAWRSAVTGLSVLRTLRASSYQETEAAWTALAFTSKVPVERVAFARIAKEVAAALYPDNDHNQEYAPALPDRVETARQHGSAIKRHRKGNPELYQRAIIQVESICEAVSHGKDSRAKRYLSSFIRTQLSEVGGEEYAVKSLCNIAQRCADMFRTDFELECLEMALELRPYDGWTLAQLADHFKRVGRFDDAITALGRATEAGQGRIAQSALADVYVQMGRYDSAMEIYRRLPDTSVDMTVRGAIADILRKQGRLDEATSEYDKIIDEGEANHRVYAGLAEIAKRQGRLEVAAALYRQLTVDQSIDTRSLYIYRLAFAQVLVRKGEYARAYVIVDEAVDLLPFAKQASVFRAAIDGLMGQASAAIRSLPQLGQSQAFDEWVSEYVRGLLLLLLSRYKDAQGALLANLESSVLDKDARAIVRLGAAVWYLRTVGGAEDAAQILRDTPDVSDRFFESIQNALSYHVAVVLRRTDEASRLRILLAGNKEVDLRTFVSAVDSEDWKSASTMEVEMLLRLVA